MKSKIKTLLIFLLVGVSLALLMNKLSPEFPVISDSKFYLDVGENVRNGGGFIIENNKNIVTPPLYPLFLSIFPLEKDTSQNTIYSVQSIIWSLCSGFVYLLIRETGGKKSIAILGSLITLFWPYGLLYSQMIYTEILYVLFLLSFAYTLILSIKSDKWITLATISGLLLGCATLTRGLTLLLPVGIIIFFWFRKFFLKNYSGFKMDLKKIIFVALVSLSILVPWEIYVYKNTGQVLPIASFGTVYKKGNETFAYLDKNGSGEKNTSWVEAKLQNVYLFWNPGASGYHVDVVKERGYNVGIFITLYKILFFTLIGLFMLGIFLYPRSEVAWISLCVILYTWAIHIVLFPFPRYTFPIMPFVTILALISFSKILSTIRKKEVIELPQ